MRLSPRLLTPAVFTGAALLAIVTAWTGIRLMEDRDEAAVRSALLAQGMTWIDVRATGLQMRLHGTAPNEAARFRARNVAGGVIDVARVRDRMEVTALRAIEAPRFSVELLRNTDGISLIGLMPAPVAALATDPAMPAPEAAPETPGLSETVAELAGGLPVSDMLETASFPAPEGWDTALEFGMAALKLLPRSKISVAADGVAIIAIADSDAQKRRFETELAKIAPPGLPVKIDISAPRPVLTPFTLRFIKDAQGARFDACSADTEAARDRILLAAKLAGADTAAICTVGLGVPTPSWAAAVESGIAAVTALGGGSITFSDADVTLQADPATPQATFDRVVGDLQAALPQVFSLKSTLPARDDPALAGPAEFTAALAEDGRLQLRGRLTDDLVKTAVDSYARAAFGAEAVYTATRMDAELPDGWPIRVLAGLEALAQLHHGNLVVREDSVTLTGVTGNTQARARVVQILSDKLGQGQSFKVDLRYDEALDPLAALPTPEECAAKVNAIIARDKITFDPGSAEIAAAANATMNALAAELKDCPALEMEIAGHTDAQGSTEGNRALSQARAEAVVIALQGRGVPVAGLRAKGYGEGVPVADNGTEEGREANRRIEFTLLKAGEPVPLSEIGAAEPEPAADAAATPAGADAAATAEGPDFSQDRSPSVAPKEMTLRPKPRPARN